MPIRFSDITGGGIPFGNTAGRPANPGTGKLYSNGETARLELYTSAGAWENIVQEVPGVASIGGQYLETNNSNTITIYGTNFVSGATAFAIGTDAVEIAATSTTFNSLVQLSAVFTGLTSANEPYDIKVVNPSNLFGILPDSLFVNNQVAWTTPVGSLGTFAEQVAISVSAVAEDDSTITYAVASGSTLPSGITLNTATGLLSGTLADVASNTTYTFTLTASDGSNPAVSRQFSILVNAAPVWVTSSGTLGTFNEGASITLSALSATDSSDTVTYALASGSSLPSGVTLNSNSGVISGTLPDIATDTTYTFTINALDGVNTIPRTFSISSNADIAIASEVLLVAGGGAGGGFSYGGGGGAGGLVYYDATNLMKFSSYALSVGSGGSQNSARAPQTSTNGGNTSFTGLTTAIGGGTGGGDDYDGLTGGSSGGNSDGGSDGTGGLTVAPTSGQGFSGGRASDGTGGGAGGGGAGGAGSNSPSLGGNRNGGLGLQYSITGTATYYAGGGGGSTRSGGTNGSGGSGIGGSGVEGGTGTAGSAGTGSGGGGGSTGGAGGSGVIIVAYPNTFPVLVIPGTLTYDQPTRTGYRVYRFTAGTGTITF